MRTQTRHVKQAILAWDFKAVVTGATRPDKCVYVGFVPRLVL